jgi:hypothetical protein
MKKFRSIILLAILIAGSVINLPAQGRQARTSSARAAYGFAPERVKHKTKKRPKARRNKVVSITRKKKKPIARRRGNWAF